MYDPHEIDVAPPSPELQKALDYLADSTAELHASTQRYALKNDQFEQYLRNSRSV